MRGHAKKCYDFLALGTLEPKCSIRQGRERRLRHSCAHVGESVCVHTARLKTKAESALSPFLLTFAARCGPHQMHDPIVHDQQHSFCFYSMLAFVDDIVICWCRYMKSISFRSKSFGTICNTSVKIYVKFCFIFHSCWIIFIFRGKIFDLI